MFHGTNGILKVRVDDYEDGYVLYAHSGWIVARTLSDGQRNQPRSKDNADRLAHRWNTHPDLVMALRSLIACGDIVHGQHPALRASAKSARVALAAAEETE